ncbi:hypothetical protein CVT25_015796 [Psilocybe cyanescens]|uniref:Zinc-finger domain-containing protein n=1 Tax=Psilocybe cyanescens TaxID=93625 RepID=A0A409X1E5_PSICY|nr:hypothetical protein CVT25_015796 [Psilocybe cyanescens]
MSSTPKPYPSVQRLNKAYVQVPQSPVSLSSYRALGGSAHLVPSSRLKENTPLPPFKLAMPQHPSSSSASTKRKISDRDSSSLVFDGVYISSTKKSKLSASTGNMTPLKAKVPKPEVPAANACPGFPNGFSYCHQCNKKRDVAAILRCTVIEKYQTSKDKTIRERLCVNKYCKQCLKNRYNEDIEVLSSQTPRNTPSHFKCPRCMGICNCPKCRKLKGLEAIGNIPKQKEPSSSKTVKKSKADLTFGKSKEVSKPTLKPLPALKWTPIPVKLTQVEADERIFIREFILRFSDSLDPIIAKTHLDELERIGGSLRTHDDDTVDWVSEVCVKAMITGLLGLLAKDHDNNISRLIKATVKDLRSVGVNLNKIWVALAALRTDITNASSSEGSTITSPVLGIKTPLSYPDPSPPPPSVMANARSLRSLRQSDDSINIVNSIQMIPVLISLIHSALETALIREDIDQSMKDSRDFTRDAKEAMKIENERWDKVRAGMGIAPKDKAQREENRVKRTVHKNQISNIDNCLKIVSKSFVSRFTTLGTDDEGRTYYALSPGVTEREAAFEYLEVASSKKPMKPKKRGRILSPDDQRELREWSWFIAVWGKRSPLSAEEQSILNHKMDCDDSDSESEDQDDLDQEKWWGFCEPEEIAKVAEWVSIKSGLEDENDTPFNQSRSLSKSGLVHSNKEKITTPLSPQQEQTKRLVAELKDYASLLEWRMREDKCALVNRFPAPNDNAKEKGRPSETAIPVEKFYQ